MQNSKIKNKIITLIGPTACNKTSTAVHLIKKFPISIIGVDSVQIYKRFNIGSAKPPQEILEKHKHHLVDRKICKDNKEDIVKILKDWTNQKEIDVIITTGGTGLTGRDITPEAIDEIADKHIPGFGEVFRTISLKTVGTSSIQSRACAALSNGKYIFALPGSSGGVTDAWDGILKHQLDINHKPCNFVELFPRLKEK